MAYEVRRDFIGYGARTPHPQWPGGAEIAVNFVINYEEGSEPSIGDGDAATEVGVSDTAPGRGVSGRDLAAEGMFEYGSRAGFWRLMRLFGERDMRPTIFACALALERNPEAAKAIVEAELDICCHGWRWENHFQLSEDVERERIAKAVASLRQTLGKAPEGWYCRYSPSVNTRRLLAEHGGFLYDSDSYADDLPFWAEVNGKGHLVVPYSLATNDAKMAGPLASPRAWAEYLCDTFDLLRREGREGAPKMMSVGLHMRMVGHAARAAGLERFLDHVKAAGDAAWVAGRADIARHWMAQHPYPG
ncbi:polysaccharide deacetylase family protein [Acetobacteraceae bacterium H6797]|nr:polysaccharide deacetylase family protein [Acetobacteraceae bacterium H6797]